MEPMCTSLKPVAERVIEMMALQVFILKFSNESVGFSMRKQVRLLQARVESPDLSTAGWSPEWVAEMATVGLKVLRKKKTSSRQTDRRTGGRTDRLTDCLVGSCAESFGEEDWVGHRCLLLWAMKSRTLRMPLSRSFSEVRARKGSWARPSSGSTASSHQHHDGPLGPV